MIVHLDVVVVYPQNLPLMFVIVVVFVVVANVVVVVVGIVVGIVVVSVVVDTRNLYLKFDQHLVRYY